MNRFSDTLRRCSERVNRRARHFMTGRYGFDKMNMGLLGAGLLLCIAGMIIRIPLVDLVLTVISYCLMFWAIFRALSRNIYKRYQENSRYLRFLEQLKDREHRYFVCPRCRQPVRVPRGKGKIAITCPKCKEKFIKKT